jgi:hypothetical protein
MALFWEGMFSLDSVGKDDKNWLIIRSGTPGKHTECMSHYRKNYNNQPLKRLVDTES